jgi:hypothetical protein
MRIRSATRKDADVLALIDFESEHHVEVQL